MNSQIFNRFLHADYLIEAETLDFLTCIYRSHDFYQGSAPVHNGHRQCIIVVHDGLKVVMHGLCLQHKFSIGNVNNKGNVWNRKLFISGHYEAVGWQGHGDTSKDVLYEQRTDLIPIAVLVTLLPSLYKHNIYAHCHV